MAEIVGKTESERLDGTDGADLIYGGGGVDTYYPAFGDDTCFGGDSFDFFYNSVGSDVAYGGRGDDKLIISLAYAPEIDVETFYGGSGRDMLWLFGLPQSQAVVFDADLSKGAITETSFGTSFSGVEVFDIGLVNNANDRILTGNGADTISTGLGDDFIDGRGGSDSLVGSYGRDSLYGGRGNDVLDGDQGDTSAGDDWLYGGLGRDHIHGGGGKDRLYGKAGADTLIGDAGDDVLQGGGGADQFAFAAGSGIDLIRDFDITTGDRLLISRAMVGEATTASDVVASFASVQGGHVVFEFGDGSRFSLMAISDTVGLAEAILLV